MKWIINSGLQIAMLLSLFSCNRSEFICSMADGSKVYLERNSVGRWELGVSNKLMHSVSLSAPCGIELFSSDDSIAEYSSGYNTINKSSDGFSGKAFIELPGPLFFCFDDRWKVYENELILTRKVRVKGNSKYGFLSSVLLKTNQQFNRNDVKLFAPGMIYGSTENLIDSAIGGRDLYTRGKGTLWIREDRLPAPLLGMMAADLSSVSVLNPLPDGRTDSLDSHYRYKGALIDSAVHIGAVGLLNKEGNFAIGYHFPSSEGEYCYGGNQRAGKHMWVRRYHPVINNFEHTYSVTFRFSNDKSFPNFYSNTWRRAWQTLKPEVIKQDIELEKRSLLDMLAEMVKVTPKVTGIYHYVPAIDKDDYIENDYIEKTSIMGFVGRAIEVASHLLYGSRDPGNPNAGKYRDLAYKILDTFLKMPMNPPAGEGFDMETGKFVVAQDLWLKIPRKEVYLRSFGDDFHTLLKIVIREGPGNYHYKEYVTWAKSFADWLLTQRNKDGGFPRKWEQGTGTILDSSALTSYNAIPMLVLMSKVTGESKYLEAAVNAGEYCWRNGQDKGIFIGATLDNPNVIDKEAGTLSMEAYLKLYEQTNDLKWLERAQIAADFAETWIYIWNVPMPVDEKDNELHWKKNNSTVGMQLITTGHSMTDLFMSYDVDEYARLSKYSNDLHYLDVAGILLHNTKQMLAIPGRLYDLKGPGWQQEHWSIAPIRGFGWHRHWLPWVSTSHLNGIIDLEEFDKNLYNQLIH